MSVFENIHSLSTTTIQVSDNVMLYVPLLKRLLDMRDNFLVWLAWHYTTSDLVGFAFPKVCVTIWYWKSFKDITVLRKLKKCFFN